MKVPRVITLISVLFLCLSPTAHAERAPKARSLPKKPLRVTRPEFESQLWVKFLTI